MKQYIDKSALVAEIERLRKNKRLDDRHDQGVLDGLHAIERFLDTLEVKEVDLDKETTRYLLYKHRSPLSEIMHKADLKSEMQYHKDIENAFKAGFELGLKAQHDNWKVVDNANLPQADRNKIYCVLSKNKYLLARVINHPQDEDLLQWKCTEFPFRRYDMCEGDKYMQIV